MLIHIENESFKSFLSKWLKLFQARSICSFHSFSQWILIEWGSKFSILVSNFKKGYAHCSGCWNSSKKTCFLNFLRLQVTYSCVGKAHYHWIDYALAAAYSKIQNVNGIEIAGSKKDIAFMSAPGVGFTRLWYTKELIKRQRTIQAIITWFSGWT